jgi:hypothetical protein
MVYCSGFDGFEDFARVCQRVGRQPARVILISARMFELWQGLIDKCEGRSEGEGGLRRSPSSL